MTLPTLPRQNKSKEADFGLQFRKWWNTTKMLGTFELKHTRGKPSIAFSELHDEQIVIGTLAHGKGTLLRISAGTIGSPDYIGLHDFPVFIVVKYTKHFYIISLSTLLLERDRSKRKSLTEDRARAISIIEV